jgi:hypothetical protein
MASEGSTKAAFRLVANRQKTLQTGDSALLLKQQRILRYMRALTSTTSPLGA